MAKATKLPSGNWNITVYIGKDKDGKRKFKSFTDKDKKAVIRAAAEYDMTRKEPVAMTFGTVAKEYIEQRRNVLSPTSIESYEKILRNNVDEIKGIAVSSITQQQIQAMVNNLAATHAPKTVACVHGFVASVLRIYRPDMRLITSLPQMKKKYKQLLTPQQVFEAVHGTDLEIPALMSMWLSLTVSEMRGISVERDIKDGVLTLQESIVDVKGKPVKKDAMKEYDRARRLEVPKYILDLINESGCDRIIKVLGATLTAKWTDLLKRKNLPHMTFHDLRHVNASVMLMLGVPDKYAMERGGWKTDYVMKSVYQNTFSDERKKIDKRVDEYFYEVVKMKFKTPSENDLK